MPRFWGISCHEAWWEDTGLTSQLFGVRAKALKKCDLYANSIDLNIFNHPTVSL
jgi:hypothetical protein